MTNMFKVYRYENDEEELNGEPEDNLEEPEGFEDVEDEEQEDPDFQGTIRTVPGACLVYKRKQASSKFEELWIYSVDTRNIKYENDIRSTILAGTDIDPTTQRSPDGDQKAETTTVGNVQYLHITGLPN